MNIKSATPSGSHGTRAPGGWARCWADNVEAHLQGLPKPWPSTAMLLDLDLWVDRVNHGGQAMPGRRCLAVRWGVGERAARTVIDRWREASPVAAYSLEGPATRPAEGPAEGPATRPASPSTMPMDSGSDVQNRPAEGPATRPAEGPASVPGLFEKLQPVGIVEAPQTSDIQTSDKSKKSRGKAKSGGLPAEELAAIVAEMHAVIAPHYPKARPPAPSSHRKEIEFALRVLGEVAADTGRSPRDLLLIGWRYMVEGTRYWRDKLALASEFYSIACTEDKCVKNARAGLEREHAAAPAPTAPATPKPKTPGEVAWDRWMEGLDAARAWYAAHKGTREGDAFHTAMETACKPNHISELFGGYMDNPKEKRVVREVFVAEYERRTTPLRLVAR